MSAPNPASVTVRKGKNNCENAILTALGLKEKCRPSSYDAAAPTYKALWAHKFERDPVCDDGGVPVSNVGERSSMDKHWGALQKRGLREYSCQPASGWNHTARGTEFSCNLKENFLERKDKATALLFWYCSSHNCENN